VNKELFIQTGSEGLVIALTEDKRLTEIAKESTSRQFAVGDIYLAKVKKIHFPLNAAFIDLGYEKDAFLHYPDLGGQFNSLNNFLQRNLHTKQRIPLSSIDLKENINKDGHIKDILIPGQKIVVQVTKEPISSKGPRLTSEITIAGRNLVLIPFSNKISVSQKIESDEEKKRLQNIIKAVKPRNYSVIVRTVAQEKTAADFDTELRLLVDKWENSFLQPIQKFKIVG
jgi:ribonuclease G